MYSGEFLSLFRFFVICKVFCDLQNVSSDRSLSSSSPPKPQFASWLIAQVDTGQYTGLCYVGQNKFRVPWKHNSRKDCNDEDSKIFRVGPPAWRWRWRGGGIPQQRRLTSRVKHRRGRTRQTAASMMCSGVFFFYNRILDGDPTMLRSQSCTCAFTTE